MNKLTVLVVVLASGLAASMPAGAVYNANVTGKVMMVITYADADYIYFSLDNQPTGLPCAAGYFAIPSSVPQNRRNQAFAQLLAAKETGTPLNIGYDSQGQCVEGGVQAHRVG
jgi:hypothetical protein